MSDHLCIGYRTSQAYQIAFLGVDTHSLHIYASHVHCIWSSDAPSFQSFGNMYRKLHSGKPWRVHGFCLRNKCDCYILSTEHSSRTFWCFVVQVLQPMHRQKGRRHIWSYWYVLYLPQMEYHPLANALELWWVTVSNVKRKEIEYFWCFFFESLIISMQVDSKCSEREKIVFVWFFGVLLVSKAIDCMIF